MRSRSLVCGEQKRWLNIDFLNDLFNFSAIHSVTLCSVFNQFMHEIKRSLVRVKWIQLSILAHLKLKNLWGAWGGSRNGSACPNSQIYHESHSAYSDSQAQSAIQTPHRESDLAYIATSAGIHIDVSGNFTSRIAAH